MSHMFDRYTPESAKPKAKATVDHPSNYNAGGIEVIDAIEAWQLGFDLGNAVKYAEAGCRRARRL